MKKENGLAENGLAEIGCWNCAISGIKNGKPVCPDCGTEIAPLCKAYSHEKIWVKKPENDIQSIIKTSI